MDIEKLIKRLRTENLYADKASLEIMDLCMEAATALSTLHAENEKLRDELEQVKREGKIPRYTIGDTVYDCFGRAWEVTSVELHSMRTKNEWLYRWGHNGTDDYCALWHFEAFPSKEAALRREQDG